MSGWKKELIMGWPAAMRACLRLYAALEWLPCMTHMGLKWDYFPCKFKDSALPYCCPA